MIIILAMQDRCEPAALGKHLAGNLSVPGFLGFQPSGSCIKSTPENSNATIVANGDVNGAIAELLTTTVNCDPLSEAVAAGVV